MLRFLALLALLSAAQATRDLLAPKAPKCNLPKLMCDGACVNGNLVDNCGACGNVCRPGESCAGNPKRCKCGPLTKSCAADQACLDDRCVCDPAQGLSQCPEGCLNLNTDVNNCGSCGNACGNVAVPECSAGECKKCSSNSDCPAGAPVCDGDGTCINCADQGLLQCGEVCVDASSDEANCGSCGNVCGNIAVPECSAGECKKCESSADCPDAAPICNSQGQCSLCSLYNETGQLDQGLPCAVRAALLGATEFQCDYPQINGGSGRCVECNVGPRANDNDCAFLISHPYPEAATIPTIDASYTYCSADNTCIAPPS